MKRTHFYRLTFINIILIGLVISAGAFTSPLWAAETATHLSTPVVLSEAELSKGPSSVADMNSALEAMAQGNFELARPYFSHTGDVSEKQQISQFPHQLMADYDQLMANLLEARQGSYQEYIDKLNENMKLIRWRQGLLDTSGTYDIDSDEKKEFEQDIQDELQKNWLDSVLQLVAAEALAEKMILPGKVDQKLHDEIISNCLEIAREFEKQDKGLDAYSKVYSVLEILDKKKYQYDQLHERLVRQASLKIIYVPDPNTDGLTWQQRRAGINPEIIYSALATLDVGYVEKPDFQKMTLKALEYCLLFSQTDSLDQTFEALNGTSAESSYQRKIQRLIEETQQKNPKKLGYTQALRVLDDLIKINSETVQLPTEVILAEFTEGAFAALDSYTYVIWPADVAEFRKDMTQEFSGAGIVISKDKEGVLKADSLISFATPAYRAGIDAGDSILAINGVETKGITMEKAVSLITGPSGSDVILTVDRESFTEPRDLTVTRRQVVVPTVKGIYRQRDGAWQYFLDPNNGVAYVHLTRFSRETPESLQRLLHQLKEQGMRALVLDLRNNGGGYHDGAIAVADNFVSAGVIDSSRYRAGQEQEINPATTKGTFDENMPLAVLINSISASASEIVSGALQDHNRALIVGTRSYGKGSVQSIQPLRFTEAQLKMTVAHYYLPNGRRVHRDPQDKTNEDYGVEPDITMELTSKQFNEYVKVQREAGILHHDNLFDAPDPDNREWKIYTADEMIASDPQLRMALLCLQARLLKNSPRLLQAAVHEE